MSSRLISHIKTSRLIINSQLWSRLNTKGIHIASADHVPYELRMPALSPSMSEGTIVKWLKQEGDTINPGDLVVDVQTDKAIVPYELEEDGTLAKIIAQESSVLKVGDLIGLVALPGEDWKSITVPTGESNAEAPTSTPAVEASSQSQTVHHHDSYLKIGPAARVLMNEYGIDPNSVTTLGPRGFLSKNNVIEYIAKNKLSPAPKKPEPSTVVNTAQAFAPPKKTSNPNVSPEYEPDFEDIELTNMRKVIAKRLVLSKTTIPHSYITATCVMDKIIALRKEMIANGQKVSLNDFIIKAAGVALKLVPEVNSNYVTGTDDFKQLQNVDISIAVATDNGLITPIITTADQLSVASISERVKGLADKARKGKLQPHEFQGGSFSISNLGMFGITEFSAVINPPQVAILAVGGSTNTFNTDMQKQTEASFTLSYDARCVELDRAFKFMNTFKYLLANPGLLNEQQQTF